MSVAAWVRRGSRPRLATSLCVLPVDVADEHDTEPRCTTTSVHSLTRSAVTSARPWPPHFVREGVAPYRLPLATLSARSCPACLGQIAIPLDAAVAFPRDFPRHGRRRR